MPESSGNLGNAKREAIGIALGVALGAGIGVALHNIPLGIGIGVALGTIFAFLRPRRGKG